MPLRTPDWQSPDEPAHYNYIAQVVAGDLLPVIEQGDWDNEYLETLKAQDFAPELLDNLDTVQYENHQPPLYYWLGAPLFALTKGSLTGFAPVFGAARRRYGGAGVCGHTGGFAAAPTGCIWGDGAGGLLTAATPYDFDSEQRCAGRGLDWPDAAGDDLSSTRQIHANVASRLASRYRLHHQNHNLFHGGCGAAGNPHAGGGSMTSTR